MEDLIAQNPARTALQRKALIKAAITLALVLALLLSIDPNEVIRALGSIPPGVLALVLLVLVADRVLMGLKWRHLVNGAGGRMRLSDAIAIYFQSGFAALLLPTSLGGEVLRGVLGQRAGVPLQLVLASMVMEKLIAGLSNLALAVIGAAYILTMTQGGEVMVVGLVVGSALIVLGSLAIAVNRRLHESAGRVLRRWIPDRGLQLLDQFSSSMVGYRRRMPVLRTNLLLNVAEHLLQFGALYLLARGLGVDFGLLSFLAVTAVVMLVRRTVGFLESWVLAEAAVVILYSLFGVPEALSLALVFSLWAASIVATVPGAYLLYRSGLGLGESWSRRAATVRRAGEPGLSRTSSPYS